MDTLVVTAWNPAYTAPADLGFGDLLARVPTTVYHGLFEDETARRATWFLPAAHELESWGDARALDGTVSLVQPLIDPLWGGVSAPEVLAAFAGLAEQGALRLLRDIVGGSRARGRTSIAGGTRPCSAASSTARRSAAETTSLDWTGLSAALSAAPAPRVEGIELGFRPDARVLDGRFADCAWLQELPDPITKLTWSNALELGPGTADAPRARRPRTAWR